MSKTDYFLGTMLTVRSAQLQAARYHRQGDGGVAQTHNILKVHFRSHRLCTTMWSQVLLGYDRKRADQEALSQTAMSDVLEKLFSKAHVPQDLSDFIVMIAYRNQQEGSAERSNPAIACNKFLPLLSDVSVKRQIDSHLVEVCEWIQFSLAHVAKKHRRNDPCVSF